MYVRGKYGPLCVGIFFDLSVCGSRRIWNITWNVLWIRDASEGTDATWISDLNLQTAAQEDSSLKPLVGTMNISENLQPETLKKIIFAYILYFVQ